MSAKWQIDVLTEAEVHGLLRACSPRAPTGQRDAALIAVMYRAGLRVSEALALTVKDVDPHTGTLEVQRGKGHKRRSLRLDPGSLAIVQRWLDCRRDRLKSPPSGPIFTTVRERRTMSTAHVRTMLRRRAKRAGIDKRVHPHGLRHSFAARMASRRVPLPVIKHSLGHASVVTTARYIDHIQPTDVYDAMSEDLFEASP